MDALVTHVPLRARDGSVVAFACVDSADIEWLSQWTWRLTPDGYACRCQRINGRSQTFRMHRELLGLSKGDGQETDHRSGNRLDNRRSNLRLVTHSQNMQNVRRRSWGRSQHRGVYFHIHSGLWHACAEVDGRKHSIGYFHSEEEAGAAARQFRAEHMPFSQEAAA